MWSDLSERIRPPSRRADVGDLGKIVEGFAATEEGAANARSRPAPAKLAGGEG